MTKEKILINRTQKLSIFEASAFSVHEGFGVRYITPFALAIGKNNPYINSIIGLLASLPPLIGNLSQLFTYKLMNKYPRKKIISIGVILQSLMWFLIIFSGAMFFIFNFSSDIALIFLIIYYIILSLFGSFVAPAWVSLMKDIVVDKKGSYFGNRNRIAGIFALTSSLIAGFILDYLKIYHLFLGFFVIFLIAFIFRFISGVTFFYHYEPKFKNHKKSYFTFYNFIRKIPSSNFGKFSLFISLFILATSIASPFFSVYMLKGLGFSYSRWTIIVLMGSAASLFFMPMWGKFIDHYGSIKSIKITGLLIPLIPFLWLFSQFFNSVSNQLFLFLVLIETFSGFLWAGFNLSYANFIYDAVSRQKTALCSAYFNILHGIGVFIGATLGGIISSFNFTFFGLSSLLFIFLLSGLARFFSYILMISKIKEVRDVKSFKYEDLKKVHVKPFLDIFNLKIIKPRPNNV